jgi:hypothetical protein
MKDKLQTNLSLYTLVVLAGIMLTVAISTPPKSILSWDVFGYYLYLPAFFIYHDLGFTDLAFVNEIVAQYGNTHTLYQLVSAPEGHLIIKYSSGLAILYLPFFLTGHVISLFTPFASDGFSLPYQFSVFAGCLLYSLAGLYFLRKVLREFFNEWITSLVLILFFLGTNYFAESVYKGAMAHNILFSLYAVILWLTILWHRQPERKYAFLLGLTLGITSMARPTDIVAILIPLLWGIGSKNSLISKIRLLGRQWDGVMILGAGFLIAWLPQLVYWKIYSGHFFFYSYDNPGEGFEFLRPYIVQVLFSFRKGWFIYTPLMIFAVAGFYFMLNKNKYVFAAIFSYFILNIYLVSSWSCWWYAESFGQRALVQSYAVMAIPFGYFIQFVFERKVWFRTLTILLLFSIVFLNLFQTWQMNKNIIHGSRMTKEYYFSVFGKTRVHPEYRNLLLVERYYPEGEKLLYDDLYMPARILKEYDFTSSEERYKSHIDTSLFLSAPSCLRMDSLCRYSPGVSLTFSEITEKDHAWIRASANVYPISGLAENAPLIVVTFSHKGKYYKYRALSLNEIPGGVTLNKWNFLTFDYLTPEVRSKDDKLSVYIWFRGNDPVYVDDFKIEAFEPLVSR